MNDVRRGEALHTTTQHECQKRTAEHASDGSSPDELKVTVAGNRMEAIRSDTQQDSEPPTEERFRGYNLCNIMLNINFPNLSFP